ncbi:hypothetical protein GCM10023166_17640 [Paeniglutamicibacter cryotolerans]|uniref:Uncharacterized protein n=1 Tax=Paeniglutamicibacter cryotolerans TaxID=670079 RepID=A0A839QPF7_9MICC|nr:hypothetical protein [Paeniglutamicibacter cryotolerans]
MLARQPLHVEGNYFPVPQAWIPALERQGSPAPRVNAAFVASAFGGSLHMRRPVLSRRANWGIVRLPQSGSEVPSHFG